MQAIQTKYLPVTNTKGSRIKATCAAKSITVGWDYGLNVEENHIQAAMLLVVELGWNVELKSGQLKDGSFVHVSIV